MFTGLIREIAEVISYQNDILSLKTKLKPKIGDSICINGACLTVIHINELGFSLELSDESRSVLAMENYTKKVHIEPAMRLSDRLEGHILQGHIDCLGVLEKIVKNENSYDFFIKVDKKHMKLIAPKGSIAIDGVSLTVNEVHDCSFRLTIISHTMKNTIFDEYEINRRLNIETDLFARYIYHMFKKDDKDIQSVINRISAIY